MDSDVLALLIYEVFAAPIRDVVGLVFVVLTLGAMLGAGAKMLSYLLPMEGESHGEQKKGA